jgi:hypothetical protein
MSSSPAEELSMNEEPRIIEYSERTDYIPEGVGTTVNVFRPYKDGMVAGHILMYEGDLLDAGDEDALKELWMAKIQCCLVSIEAFIAEREKE